MNAKRTALSTIIVLAAVVAPLVVAYEPAPGGDLIDQFASPISLGRSGAPPMQESVSGDTINPAASALKQRTHLDASYLSIVSDGSVRGHAANIGAAFPYPVGVFSGSLSFMSVDETAINLGQRVGVSLGFSKDLYPRLLFGAGLRGRYGSNEGESGFAGGLDLGVINTIGAVGPLRDVSWGLAVTQMGNGLALGYPSASPAPFTPALSASATVVDTDSFDLGATFRLTAPTFQSVTAHATLAAKLFDRVSIAGGWDFNAAETGASNLPSLSLTYHARTDLKTTEGFVAEQGWARSEIDVHGAFAPLYDDVYAAGLGLNAALGVVDEDPPSVGVDYTEERYLSPNNDGASDELLLPIDITDERYVKGWALSIYDESGALVQTIENKEQREENVTFRNVLDRLFYVKQGVDVPPEVRWDGRTAEGGLAPDGRYTFTVSAFDDNANAAVTDSFTVTIDATPPAVAIVEPDDPDDLIFSPNGDNNKDTIVVDQEGSEEDQWIVEVRDVDDRVIREERFAATRPASFEWDGRDDQGALVPDGVYSVTSSSVDRAENRGAATLANIIVNTEPTPLGLTVDRSEISPNGDGVSDALTLTPDVPVKEGIRTWQYVIIDANETAVRTIQSNSETPESWEFDGRADDGSRLPEGRYVAEFSVRYNNGNNPVVQSPRLTVDVTPPFASVRPDVEVFSPNGDGRIDAVTFAQVADAIRAWTGTIRDSQGTVVRSFQWSGEPLATLPWDGRDDKNEQLPDGTYRYVLSGRDVAGNLTETAPAAVRLDTRETPVFVSTGTEAFSPNGDGRKDRISIFPELADRRGVTGYSVAILDANNEPVASIERRNAPPDDVEWDGRLPGGRIIPDGEYQVSLVVDYLHGNRPGAVSAPFTVDTVAPTASFSLGDTLFSPDGDGNKDVIAIEQSSSAESSWTMEVVASNGTVVRTVVASGTLQPTEWDGTDDSGNQVPDGPYRYRLRSVDESGNPFETVSAPFTVDTAPVAVRLTQSETAFSPNGDDIKESVTITPVATSDDEVDSWSIRIAGEDDETVLEREFTGGLIPFEWRGETERGRAPDGEYRVLVVTRFSKGNIELASTRRPIVLDTQAPTATVAINGDVFSPNGDGNLDTLRIDQETSIEQRWAATISDASGNLVRGYDWIERPEATILFDGLAEGRRRLPDGTYTYELFSTDEAGNTGGSGPRSFEIVTTDTPLELVADTAAFSPDGDGRLDSVVLTPRAGSTVGITRYALAVTDAADDIVFERSGTRLPDAFDWNGRTGTGTGGTLPDGTYTASLSLTYRHGNAPVARSIPILLDTAAPDVSVRADAAIFSPNGDGQRDTVTISQTSENADGWRATIVNDDGDVVRRFGWPDRVATVVWDGTDEAGNRVPDRTYTYEVAGEDVAGNRSSASVASIRVDTRPVRLYVTVAERAFSPNGDGVLDSLPVRLINTRPDGVEYRTVEFVGADGTVARTFRAEESPAREELTWDGRTRTAVAADGLYRVRFRAAYDNGTIAEALSPPVRIDTVGPDLAATVRGLPFSPDNDGLNDELSIDLSVSDESAIEEWIFAVNDRNARPFQIFEGSGTPRDNLIWDGRSQRGELVISAEDYPYLFTAVDAVGNSSSETGLIPVDILVIRDGDRLKVQISNINFEPNSPELQLDVGSEAGRKNVAVLDRLVEVFDKYESYAIRIEGHAVNVTGTDREEREELQPLSLARAQTVRGALVERGMEPDRISTLGRGGTEPLVPHGDLENRWKNRRVEFILLR